MGTAQGQPSCCGHPLYVSAYTAQINGYIYKMNLHDAARVEKKALSPDSQITSLTAPFSEDKPGYWIYYYPRLAYDADGEPRLFALTRNAGLVRLNPNTLELEHRRPWVHGVEAPGIVYPYVNGRSYVLGRFDCRSNHDKTAWIENGWNESTDYLTATEAEYTKMRIQVSNFLMTETPLEIVGKGTDLAKPPGQPVNSWIPGLTGSALAIDPVDPVLYYAGTNQCPHWNGVNYTPKGWRSFIRQVNLDGSNDLMILDGWNEPSLATDLNCIQVDRTHDCIFATERARYPDDANTGDADFDFYNTPGPPRIVRVDLASGELSVVVTTDTAKDALFDCYWNDLDQKLYYMIGLQGLGNPPHDPTKHGIRRCNWDGTENELWLPFDKLRPRRYFDYNYAGLDFNPFDQFALGPHHIRHDCRA